MDYEEHCLVAIGIFINESATTDIAVITGSVINKYATTDATAIIDIAVNEFVDMNTADTFDFINESVSTANTINAAIDATFTNHSAISRFPSISNCMSVGCSVFDTDQFYLKDL